MPELVLEGAASEYSFADVRDAVPNYEPLLSPFHKARGHAADPDDVSPRGGAHAAVGSNNLGTEGDQELQREVKGLKSEMNLRREEYSSNLKEKEATIQKLQIQIQVKEDQLKQMTRRSDVEVSAAAKARK